MTEIKVERFIKIPWVDKGRDFSGCDCYGLVRLVLHETFGKDLPDFQYGSALEDKSRLIDENKSTIEATPVESPIEGDIVVMLKGKYPTHVGVFIDGGYVLHTDRKMGTCCERINSWRLKDSIEGFYRV